MWMAFVSVPSTNGSWILGIGPSDMATPSEIWAIECPRTVLENAALSKSSVTSSDKMFQIQILKNQANCSKMQYKTF